VGAQSRRQWERCCGVIEFGKATRWLVITGT
jgi:hypothetical protein